jgi:hypothetical protein
MDVLAQVHEYQPSRKLVVSPGTRRKVIVTDSWGTTSLRFKFSVRIPVILK